MRYAHSCPIRRQSDTTSLPEFWPSANSPAASVCRSVLVSSCCGAALEGRRAVALCFNGGLWLQKRRSPLFSSFTPFSPSQLAFLLAGFGRHGHAPPHTRGTNPRQAEQTPATHYSAHSATSTGPSYYEERGVGGRTPRLIYMQTHKRLGVASHLPSMCFCLGADSAESVALMMRATADEDVDAFSVSRTLRPVFFRSMAAIVGQPASAVCSSTRGSQFSLEGTRSSARAAGSSPFFLRVAYTTVPSCYGPIAMAAASSFQRIYLWPLKEKTSPFGLSEKKCPPLAQDRNAGRPCLPPLLAFGCM